jgi:hypothetical protein
MCLSVPPSFQTQPLVSSVGGGAIVLFVVHGNDLEPFEKFDVFVELLLILLTLLAVLGYGIYTWIGNKLESRLNKTGSDLESRLNEIFKNENERLEKEQQEIQNSRLLFIVRLQRNMGFVFWKLFDMEKKKEEGKNTSVLKELIKLAIERTEITLDFAKKNARKRI